MLRQIKISRLLFQWLLSTFGMIILAFLFPGVIVTDAGSVFFASAMIGLLNALLWPLFMQIALPVTVATLGLASLVLNGLIVSVTSYILPGFTVTNFWAAIGVSLGLAILTAVFHQLLVINDDDTYYRNVIKRQAKKNKNIVKTKIPGILFLQIDGLAYEVLKRALSDGNAPTLAKWLREGDYRLEKWETMWSSQTGASQAGILMGSNKNIPAFRWLEKDTNKIMTCGHPRDVRKIEERITTHKGLLAHDGASRGNLFSGDAQYTLLTLSTVTNPDRKHFGQDYYAYFANPYNFTRTVIFVISDIFHEIRESIKQRQWNVLPRLDKKGRFYPLLRAWTNVVQRDIVIQTLISDMYKGRSVIYADFVGYDEVSHHSGVERFQTIAVLREIDKQIARLAPIAKDAPRPYHLVILSDHGQTQGATFNQRTGVTLQELVHALSNKKVTSETKNEEGTMYLKAAVTEASAPKNVAGKTLHSMTKKQTANGHNEPGREITVMASGCLGLIYFNTIKRRATYEEIQKLYPGLIDGLRKQKYIGFLLMNSKKYGGIIINKNGIYPLAKEYARRNNPLRGFGSHALEKVRATNKNNYVADIMINSFYDKNVDEVAAFEEQVGSHGGMGGKQSYPFVFFPKNWYFPQKELLGAEKLHLLLKHWLLDIGQLPKLSSEIYQLKNPALNKQMS